MNENLTEISNRDLLDILLKAIKEEGNKNKEDIKKQIEEENKKLRSTLEEQSGKLNSLEKKCSELENKCLIYERNFRKNNIVIFGLNITDGDLLTPVLNTLNELLGVDIIDTDINNIYNIKTNTSYFTKVEFVTYLKKSIVLKNVQKLKGTGISIAQDLCFDDRKTRKILLPHLKLAKSKNLYAKILGNKLQVNDELYTIDQLENINPLKNNEEQAAFEVVKSNSAPSTPSHMSSSSMTTESNVLILSEEIKVNKKDEIEVNQEKKRKLESPVKLIEVKHKKTGQVTTASRTSSRNRVLSNS